MKTFLCLGCAAVVAATSLLGCAQEEAKDDKAMRNALTNPPKFDINNVPEKDREMVRRMTGENGTAAPGTSAPR